MNVSGMVSSLVDGYLLCSLWRLSSFSISSASLLFIKVQIGPNPVAANVLSHDVDTGVRLGAITQAHLYNAVMVKSHCLKVVYNIERL